MYGPQGDLLHLSQVILNAGHPAEEHAVSQFAQNCDGLAHQVNRTIVDACLSSAHLFSNQPNIHFRCCIRQQVEGRASQTITYKLRDSRDSESQMHRDAGEHEIANAQNSVLDEQGADIGPNTRAIPSHDQTNAQVAYNHSASAQPVRALKFIFRIRMLLETTLKPEMTKLREIQRNTGRRMGSS